MRDSAKSRSSAFWLAGIILLSSGWFGGAGQAQDAPMCNQVARGQVTCFATKLCECIYDRGGTTTGVPAGYRWDCGILKPSCEVVPATIVDYGGYPPSYPTSVAIDRSNHSVNVDQDSTNDNANTNTNTSTSTSN